MEEIRILKISLTSFDNFLDLKKNRQLYRTQSLEKFSQYFKKEQQEKFKAFRDIFSIKNLLPANGTKLMTFSFRNHIKFDQKMVLAIIEKGQVLVTQKKNTSNKKKSKKFILTQRNTLLNSCDYKFQANSSNVKILFIYESQNLVIHKNPPWMKENEVSRDSVSSTNGLKLFENRQRKNCFSLSQMKKSQIFQNQKIKSYSRKPFPRLTKHNLVSNFSPKRLSSVEKQVQPLLKTYSQKRDDYKKYLLMKQLDKYQVANSIYNNHEFNFLDRMKKQNKKSSFQFDIVQNEIQRLKKTKIKKQNLVFQNSRKASNKKQKNNFQGIFQKIEKNQTIEKKLSKQPFLQRRKQRRKKINHFSQEY